MFKRHTLTLFLLLSFQSFGYKFTQDFNLGFYWSSFPINIIASAKNATDSQELYDNAESAMREWENNINQKNLLWNLGGGAHTGSNPGGNVIRWADDFAAETGFDPNSTLAVAIRYQQGPYFVKTEIVLNPGISSLRNNVNNTLYKVLLHELGHTLGLDHSDDWTALMAPVMSSTGHLQHDDIQGGTALVNETHHRQTTGFVSNALGQGSDENAMSSCGTVDMGSGGSNGPGGPLSFLFSLMLGLLAVQGRNIRSNRFF